MIGGEAESIASLGCPGPEEGIGAENFVGDIPRVRDAKIPSPHLGRDAPIEDRKLCRDV